MADPVGAALGAVSLGLTVCGGIIKYLDAWKTQEKEIHTVKDAVEGLEGLLRQLELRLQKQPSLSSSTAKQLESCIQACNKKIDSILELSENYARPSTLGWREDARYQFRKLVFPFKRDTLFQLEDQLQNLQRNLHTALHCLEIDLGQLVYDQTHVLAKGIDSIKSGQTTAEQNVITEIQTSEYNISSHLAIELSRHVPALQDSLQSTITASSNSLNTRIQEISTKALPDVQQNITASIDMAKNHLGAGIQGINNNVSLLNQAIQIQAQGQAQENKRIEEMLKRELSMLRIAGLCPQSPRNDQNQPSDFTIVSKRLETVRRHSRQARVLPRHPYCTCGMRKSAAIYSRSWGSSFYVTSDVCSIHDLDCNVRYMSKGNRSTRFSFGIGRFRVNGSVDITYSPQGYFRTFCIAPNLRFQVTVPESSPAFSMITKFMSRFREMKDATERDMTIEADKYVEELSLIFRDGKASPYDVNRYGQNLLHTITPFYRDCVLAPRLIPIFQTIIDFLTTVGVDWCERDVWDRTPFDGMLDHFGYSDAARKWQNVESPSQNEQLLATMQWAGCRSVAQPPVESMFAYYDKHSMVSTMVLAQSGSDQLLEALLYGPLSISVLRRDLSETQKLLSKCGGGLLAETNTFKQNPLHLAADWKEGLQLLLPHSDETALSSHDAWNLTALDYAILLDSIDSARLLLHAGGDLSGSWFTCWSTSNQDDPDEDEPDEEDAENDNNLHKGEKTEAEEKRMRSWAFRWEALRILREKLRDIALETLPDSALRDLQINATSIPDVSAREIVAEINEHGLRVPNSVFTASYPQGSIYHYCIAEDYEILQSLFDSGFHDTDAQWHGVTSLMTTYREPHSPYCHFELVRFLITHGGNLHRAIPSKLIENAYGETIFSENKFLAIHKIAATIGELISNHLEEDNSGAALLWYLEPEIPAYGWWAEFLLDESADGSCCGCSKNGSSPLAIFVREVQGQRSWPDDSNSLLLAFAGMAQALSHKIRIVSEAENVAERAFRSITFAALGLTHTCAKYDPSYPLYTYPEPMVQLLDPEEVKEIREEEQHLLQQLDELVEKFMVDFKERHIYLHQFIEYFWEPGMSTFLSQHEIIDVAEVEKLVEIGVRVQEVDDNYEN